MAQMRSLREEVLSRGPGLRLTRARIEHARRTAVASLLERGYVWTAADTEYFNSTLARLITRLPWRSTRQIAEYIREMVGLAPDDDWATAANRLLSIRMVTTLSHVRHVLIFRVQPDA
eukprot:SAG31_NODE_4316_length_3363_cov_11.868862_4_plen_118_part_00